MDIALRGTGIVKPGMLVQMFTVVLNVIFALRASLHLWRHIPHALGNTRLLTFAGPVYWLSHRAGFQTKPVCDLSVLTMTLQDALALWRLRGELHRKEIKMATARLAV